MNIISSLRDEILLEKQEETEREMLLSKLDESKPLLIEKLLKQMIYGELEEEHFFRQIKSLNLDLQFKNFSMLVFEFNSNQVDMSENGLLSYKKSIEKILNFLNSHFSNRYIYVPLNNNYLCVLMDHITDTYLLTESLNGIIRKIHGEQQVSVTVGLSRQYSAFTMVSTAFKECIDCLNQKWVDGENRVINFNTIDRSAPQGVVHLKEHEEKLLEDFKRGDVQVFAGALNEFEVFIKLNKVLFSQVQTCCFELMILFARILEGKGFNGEELYKESILNKEKIFRCNTIRQLMEFFKQSSLEYIKKVQSSKQGRYRPEITRAIRYIEQNYHMDLTLDMVAQELFISSFYLSHLFSKELGVTFLEYLTDVRIQKAKDLIETGNYKVYEIAQKVGYSNENYFSYVFKKVSGYSPSEYKKKTATGA